MDLNEGRIAKINTGELLTTNRDHSFGKNETSQLNTSAPDLLSVIPPMIGYH